MTAADGDRATCENCGGEIVLCLSADEDGVSGGWESHPDRVAAWIDHLADEHAPTGTLSDELRERLAASTAGALRLIHETAHPQCDWYPALDADCPDGHHPADAPGQRSRYG